MIKDSRIHVLASVRSQEAFGTSRAQIHDRSVERTNIWKSTIVTNFLNFLDNVRSGRVIEKALSEGKEYVNDD